MDGRYGRPSETRQRKPRHQRVIDAGRVVALLLACCLPQACHTLGDVRVEAHRRCAVLQLQGTPACDPPCSRVRFRHAAGDAIICASSFKLCAPSYTYGSVQLSNVVSRQRGNRSAMALKIGQQGIRSYRSMGIIWDRRYLSVPDPCPNLAHCGFPISLKRQNPVKIVTRVAVSDWRVLRSRHN